MTDRYDVTVKVVSQKGTCGAKHKVGDQWTITGKTPEGICLSAYDVIYPSIRLLMYGGALPWETDKEATTLACSDAANPVVFEIRRVKK